MKRLLLCVCCMTILCRCAKESPMFPETRSEPEGPFSESILSMDEVQALALEIPNLCTMNGMTRAVRPMIKEVAPLSDYLTSPLTRAGDFDPATIENIHVVTYEDNQGFAILSADKRIGELIAYTECGTLEDCIDNPGIAMLVSSIPAMAAEQLAQAVMDTIIDGGGGGGAYTRDEWLTLDYGLGTPSGYAPIQHYHQGYPYNEYCPKVCGTTINSHALTGSGPLAFAQLMSHHGKPASFQYAPENNVSLSLSWTPSATNSNLQKFIHQIGLSTGQSYLCSESDDDGGNLRDMRAKLSLWGYRHDGYHGYDIQYVKQDLNNGCPVLLRGASSTTPGRYIWVVEGYSAYYKRLKGTRYYYDASGTLYKQEDLGIRSEYQNNQVVCAFGAQGNSGAPVWCVDNWMQNGSYVYKTNVDMLRHVRPE